MALVTKRQCDVFKTTKNVERYCVKVCQMGDDDKELAIWREERDLSPHGLKRLKKFIRRGMTPPGVNSTQTEHEGATHEDDREAIELTSASRD